MKKYAYRRDFCILYLFLCLKETSDVFKRKKSDIKNYTICGNTIKDDEMDRLHKLCFKHRNATLEEKNPKINLKIQLKTSNY